MAMRAVLKKISSPPSNISFLERRPLIPPTPYLGRLGSSILGDKRYPPPLLNNKEEIVLSGARKIDENWWKSKKNKKIEKELYNNHVFYLQNLSQGLYLQPAGGYQTRQLLSIYMDHNVGGRGGIFRFATTTPFDIGLQNSKLLELDRAPYGLPRQTVNGLVCITTWDKELFVIYNPSTGEKSPWIKTTAALETSENYRPREVSCIAFGFDPTRKEHKVICISYPRKCNFPEFEVLTIDKNTWMGSGENIWRRLGDDVFSCASWEDALRSWLAGTGVYVNGSIYWLLPGERWEGIMLTEFDVLKEKFQYHSINGENPRSAIRLMEFDGHVGILKRISDYEASVKILNKKDEIDGMERYDWIEETISLPCAWTLDVYQRPIKFEALAGTTKILIQNSDSVFCYDPYTKESVRFPILRDSQRIMQL